MDKRSALIVATSAYDDPKLRKLRAPAHDANTLARVLGDPTIGNFAVSVLADETESRVRRDIAAFFRVGALDDVLLLHFACHGVKDEDGNLYFAATDTEMENLDATAVSAEFVNRQMTRSRSRRIVLLLDCCYSGAFASGMAHRGDQGVQIKERFEGRGRVVLTASNAMEYAWEGEDLLGTPHPSVFTTAVVRGLETGHADRDGDGLVSVDELYDYVFEQVRETTPSQTPGKWTFDVAGDLYIARSPRTLRSEPSGLPPELKEAMDSPFAGVREGAVRELNRLLLGRDRAAAAAARDGLETLREDDSRSVSAAAWKALAEFDAPPAPGAEIEEGPVGAPADAPPTAPEADASRAWPPSGAGDGRSEPSRPMPVGGAVTEGIAAVWNWMSSRSRVGGLLGSLGALALIVGGLSNWAAGDYPGTTIKARIFYSAEKETGSEFFVSAGFVVILIGLVAMAGILMRKRLVIGFAGALGITAFILTRRSEDLAGDIGIGMWLIVLGGATTVVTSFIQGDISDGGATPMRNRPKS